MPLCVCKVLVYTYMLYGVLMLSVPGGEMSDWLILHDITSLRSDWSIAVMTHLGLSSLTVSLSLSISLSAQLIIYLYTNDHECVCVYSLCISIVCIRGNLYTHTHKGTNISPSMDKPLLSTRGVTHS